MYGTVRNMIENMAYLVHQYGFIPNGNRIYYLNRSQPPLLTWSVEAYYTATQDLEFVRNIMPALEKEMDFFLKNKLINNIGWKSHLFQFKVSATGPRPESYREDVESAEHIEDILEKQRLWGDIAAAGNY
jgi:alpha,alpha-trehalase